MFKKFLQKIFIGESKMKAKELRDQVFKDFRAWMDKHGVKREKDETSDPFSMDVYMTKVFDIMYDQYLNEQKHNQQKRDLVMNFQSSELKEILEARLQAENMAKGNIPKNVPAEVNTVTKEDMKKAEKEAGAEGTDNDDPPADNVKEFPKKNG